MFVKSSYPQHNSPINPERVLARKLSHTRFPKELGNATFFSFCAQLPTLFFQNIKTRTPFFERCVQWHEFSDKRDSSDSLSAKANAEIKFVYEMNLSAGAEVKQFSSTHLLINKGSQISVFDVNNQKIVCSFEENISKIRCVVSLDQLIAITDKDFLFVYGWDGSDKVEKMIQKELNGLNPTSLAILPEGIVMSFSDGSIKLMSFIKQDEFDSFTICQAEITCMTSHPKNPYLLFVGSKKGLFLFDTRRHELSRISSRSITHLDVKERSCFVLCSDGTIKGWEVLDIHHFSILTKIKQKKPITAVDFKIHRATASMELFLVGKDQVKIYEIKQKV